VEESAGGNACGGEPIDGNGNGKSSVGEPAEGSFIIYANVLLEFVFNCWFASKCTYY
jgi:hypothetical protein